jgi:hypothetical protein
MLRRFMIVRTFASILTGLVVWLFALGAGLGLAAAWGAIAFALNYIPFLGPFCRDGASDAVCHSAVRFMQMAVVIFASLNVTQFIIGSYRSRGLRVLRWQYPPSPSSLRSSSGASCGGSRGLSLACLF